MLDCNAIDVVEKVDLVVHPAATGDAFVADGGWFYSWVRAVVEMGGEGVGQIRECIGEYYSKVCAKTVSTTDIFGHVFGDDASVEENENVEIVEVIPLPANPPA